MAEALDTEVTETVAQKRGPGKKIAAAVVRLLVMTTGGYAYWLRAGARETTDDA